MTAALRYTAAAVLLLAMALNVVFLILPDTGAYPIWMYLPLIVGLMLMTAYLVVRHR